jgi:hypothetical protein
LRRNPDRCERVIDGARDFVPGMDRNNEIH